jgi:hypothetical protein
MKGKKINKVKYWVKALAMDTEALNYAMGVPSNKWKKHVEYYLPVFKDSIKNMEGCLNE